MHKGKGAQANCARGITNESACTLPLYPIDMERYAVASEPMEQDRVAVDASTHPAYSALCSWNSYLLRKDEAYRSAFLASAYRLVEDEVRIGEDAGGWLICSPGFNSEPGTCWLSASVQGCGISALTRAYLLTGEGVFLAVARRAIRTFERDILDGGISAPLGKDGIFFEDVAVYPATHTLNGCILALFGLYDAIAWTGENHLSTLLDRGLLALHALLDEFDCGFWAYADLLHRQLASPAQLMLQADLLEALAERSACDQCRAIAARWRGYGARRSNRLRYALRKQWSRGIQAVLAHARERYFPRRQQPSLQSVCVPLPAFPFTGGILTVLEGMEHLMKDLWRVEFLAQHTGPNPGTFVIHRFGTPDMAPTQFPSVWLYVLNGVARLLTLMRRGASYQLILPQDGLYTAAFAALAAKVAGVRVVCIDHGQLTLLKNWLYRSERIKGLETRPLPVRLIGRLRFALYWPSLSLLARISARLVDHFLIPGVEGDEIEERCRELGISSSRLTRFASMVDVERHYLLDMEERVKVREGQALAADALVVAIICRLAPEKGLDIAVESIALALSRLAPELVKRVRIVIAGDGPLRRSLERQVQERGLKQAVLFWGDLSADQVRLLLSLSDIFLYTSTRGACFPMAVLEAMASGCAVIASEQPLANATLLAEGRGIAVRPGSIEQTSAALLRLLNDADLRSLMGRLARNYIIVQHSAARFRRDLLRVTQWAALSDWLVVDSKQAVDEKELRMGNGIV